MRPVVAAFAIGGLFAATCLAADAPFELHGLRIGMSQDDVAAIVDHAPDCLLPKPPKPLDECHYDRRDSHGRKFDKLAGEPIQAWSFRFADRRLGYVTVIFPHASFAAIKGSLLSRYGKPSRTETEPVQDDKGATLQSEVLSWYRGDEILHATEYAGGGTKSQVSLASMTFLHKAANSGR